MIRFNSDYLEGAHPRILERLVETNMEQTPGYGEDEYCAKAAGLIRELCQSPKADVHFLVGGTQTNTIVISSALRSYQGVIAAETGHISTHETGAIEAKGHKVLALPSADGKISASQIKEYVLAHRNDESFEHIVQPKLVYISQPTEYGTIYQKKELEEIYRLCQELGLLLYVDGARLGYALASAENDLTLPVLASNCDAFYIGGTKVGALFGEAVVLLNHSLKCDFRYGMKQHGGLLAKGRLLGIQFLTLFENGLYFEISDHAARLADQIREKLSELGILFKVNSPTNQIFPVLPDDLLAKLKNEFTYAYDAPAGNDCSSVRFCTSWATRKEDVDQLLLAIEEYYR